MVEPGTVYIKTVGSQTVTAQLYQIDGTTTGKFLNSQTGTGTLQVNYSDIPGQKYWLKVSQSGTATPTAYSLDFGLYQTTIIGGSQADTLKGGSKADSITGADGPTTLHELTNSVERYRKRLKLLEDVDGLSKLARVVK